MQRFTSLPSNCPKSWCVYLDQRKQIILAKRDTKQTILLHTRTHNQTFNWTQYYDYKKTSDSKSDFEQQWLAAESTHHCIERAPKKKTPEVAFCYVSTKKTKLWHVI